VGTRLREQQRVKSRCCRKYHRWFLLPRRRKFQFHRLHCFRRFHRSRHHSNQYLQFHRRTCLHPRCRRPSCPQYRLASQTSLVILVNLSRFEIPIRTAIRNYPVTRYRLANHLPSNSRYYRNWTHYRSRSFRQCHLVCHSPPAARLRQELLTTFSYVSLHALASPSLDASQPGSNWDFA
jgi:hypothetical protein